MCTHTYNILISRLISQLPNYFFLIIFKKVIFFDLQSNKMNII